MKRQAQEQKGTTSNGQVLAELGRVARINNPERLALSRVLSLTTSQRNKLRKVTGLNSTRAA